MTRSGGSNFSGGIVRLAMRINCSQVAIDQTLIIYAMVIIMMDIIVKEIYTILVGAVIEEVVHITVKANHMINHMIE